MDGGPLQRLRGFVERVGGPNRSLTVINSTEPAPVTRLLTDAFDDQPLRVDVEVSDREMENLVALVEDGAVVATSSLAELMDAYLLVNSDLYRTGTSGVDKYDAPAVLTGLHDQTFRLRGFPKSNKEKLLLVLMSRYIERLALDAGSGAIRSSFQRLSRIDDERGTKQVYERLVSVGVDTHVYGVPDVEPDGLPDGIHVHAGESVVYRDSWFVVFDPGDGAVPAALVAVADGDNEWLGRWTFDEALVAEVVDVVSDI